MTTCRCGHDSTQHHATLYECEKDDCACAAFEAGCVNCDRLTAEVERLKRAVEEAHAVLRKWAATYGCTDTRSAHALSLETDRLLARNRGGKDGD